MLLLGVLSACGTDGRTPVCIDFPQPYDVRVAESRDRVRDELRSAAARGCLTLPSGFDDANAGAGGQDGAEAGQSGAEAGSQNEPGNGGTAGSGS